MVELRISLNSHKSALLECADRAALQTILSALDPAIVVGLQIKGLVWASSLKELVRFTELQSLGFEQCTELLGFPRELGKLPNLRHLEISDCPDFHRWDGVESLSQILSLSVHSCDCVGHVPESVGGLKSLRALSLRHCDQLFELSPQIAQLALLILDIHGCHNLLPLGAEFEHLALRSENIRDMARGLEYLEAQPVLTGIVQRLERSKFSSDYAGLDD